MSFYLFIFIYYEIVHKVHTVYQVESWQNDICYDCRPYSEF